MLTRFSHLIRRGKAAIAVGRQLWQRWTCVDRLASSRFARSRFLRGDATRIAPPRAHAELDARTQHAGNGKRTQRNASPRVANVESQPLKTCADAGAARCEDSARIGPPQVYGA
jgi:hypothetical protein